jgi:hypothetical protein
MPAAMQFGSVRRFVFRTISQLAFEYRESPVSVGSAGNVPAGDRLPWVRLDDGGDNHSALRDLHWQVHVYGKASEVLETCCAKNGLRLRQFSWIRAARAAGLKRDALYLLRPDGHVGFASPSQDAGALADYLSRLQLRPRGQA